MPVVTKACSLKEYEVKALIQYHARQVAENVEGYAEYVERMRYLTKRLEEFKPKATNDNEPSNSTWGNT